MNELGIDISNHYPKTVDQFLSQSFDYVVTVCDNAKESCPVFIGRVRHQLHRGFDDPAEASGSDDEILLEFRRVRDEIKNEFRNLYNHSLKSENT